MTGARRGRALGLLWLFVGAVPGLDAADAEARPGRFKIGPLSLTPRFELRNAGVDTNVFHTLTDPTPDASIVSRLALDGSLAVGRRLRLAGNGYADVNYFRREGSERSLDYGGEGRAELSLGRLALFAGGGGLQGKQRFSIELTQRVLRQERWATAGLDLALTRRLSTRWIGTLRDHEFGSLLVGGEDIKQRLDRRAIGAGLEARYALTAKTSAVASAERIEDRFFRQSGAAPRRTLSYRYLAGFELSERALVKGRALAGLRRLPGGFGGEGAPGYAGPALALATGLRLGRVARVDALADRDVYYSAEGVRVQDLRLRSAYVYSRYRAELAVELPLELEGSGFGEWQRARFLLPLRESDSFLRLDRVRTFGGSVLRRFGEGVKVGGTLAWSQRLTNAPGLSYEGLVYGLQAEIVP